MDKEIEAIILQEAGLGKPRHRKAEDVSEVDEDGAGSDAYSAADERQELIEFGNDILDTLVDESQDVSTEGVDRDGWGRD